VPGQLGDQSQVAGHVEQVGDGRPAQVVAAEGAQPGLGGAPLAGEPDGAGVEAAFETGPETAFETGPETAFETWRGGSSSPMTPTTPARPWTWWIPTALFGAAAVLMMAAGTAGSAQVLDAAPPCDFLCLEGPISAYFFAGMFLVAAGLAEGASLASSASRTRSDGAAHTAISDAVGASGTIS